MLTAVTTAILVLACAAAAWFDLRERRIPNWLTVGAVAAALLLRLPGGLGEVGAGLAGVLVGFAVALPLFLVGGLGGGDLKLIAAIGAFLGPARLFFALLITALVGGAMAIAIIIRRKAGPQTAANLYTLISTFSVRSFAGWKKDSGVPLTIHSPSVITLPYGVAIALGAVVAWLVYASRPGWSLLATLAG